MKLAKFGTILETGVQQGSTPLFISPQSLGGEEIKRTFQNENTFEKRYYKSGLNVKIFGFPLKDCGNDK